MSVLNNDFLGYGVNHRFLKLSALAESNADHSYYDGPPRLIL